METRCPSTTIDIKELVWHFKVPFWEKDDTDDWNLTPRQVIRGVKGTSEHQKRVKEADLKYPIAIMKNKGKWLVLDGLHRLVKAYNLGIKIVKVKKIPRTKIPEIRKEFSRGRR